MCACARVCRSAGLQVCRSGGLRARLSCMCLSVLSLCLFPCIPVAMALSICHYASISPCLDVAMSHVSVSLHLRVSPSVHACVRSHMRARGPAGRQACGGARAGVRACGHAGVRACWQANTRANALKRYLAELIPICPSSHPLAQCLEAWMSDSSSVDVRCPMSFGNVAQSGQEAEKRRRVSDIRPCGLRLLS